MDPDKTEQPDPDAPDKGVEEPAPKPDAAAEAAKVLADARAMIADNAKQTATLASLTSRILDERRPAAPVAPVEEDDPEIDLTDQKAVAKEITRRAEKAAEKLLKQHLGELTSRYTADRTDDLRTRETMIREQLRATNPVFRENEADVDAYLAPFRAQDPAIGGRAGALDEALLRVLGKKALEARIQKESRATNVNSQSRSTVLDNAAASFDKETIEEASKRLRGVSFEDSDEIEALAGNVEDFARHILKKQQKRSA